MNSIIVPARNEVGNTASALPSFEELVTTFLSNKDLRASSALSYRASFNQFAEFLKLSAVTLVTKKEIKKFKQYLINYYICR